MPLEIRLQGFQQLIHIQLLRLKNQVPDGQQGIGRVDAGSHNGVHLRIAGAAGLFAHALFNAPIEHNGTEHSGDNLEACHLAQIGVMAGNCEEVAELFLYGIVHFFKGFETARVACLGADLFLGGRILAIIEHELNGLGQTGLIFLRDKAAFAADAGGHTAVVAAVAGVFQGNAVLILGETGKIAFDHHGIIEDLGLAGSTPDTVDHLVQERLREFGMIKKCQRGLNAVHANLRLKKQFLKLRAGIVAISVNAADGDSLTRVAGKGLRVGSALVFAQFHVLDPLELQQGDNLLSCELPFLNILFVERIHVLSVTPGRSSAGHLLHFNGQMDEPEGLDGLTEVACRKFRDMAADFGDFQQFCLITGISGFRGRFFAELSIAVGMGDDSLCRHNHSPIQVVLFLIRQCCRTFGEAAL